MRKVQLVKSSQPYTEGIPFNRSGEQNVSLAESGRLLAQVTGGQYGDDGYGDGGFGSPYGMGGGYGGFGYPLGMMGGFGSPFFFPFRRRFRRFRRFCCCDDPCDDFDGFGGY